MITAISKRFIARSFTRAKFEFSEKPRCRVRAPFGIYIHVPFCRTICSFCPFYKERFDPKAKGRYLEALCHEIAQSPMSGHAAWLYMGGGTPNTLPTSDIERIIAAVRSRVTVDDMGIELLPTLLKEAYLERLRRIGFNKVSMGVESFCPCVLDPSRRKRIAPGLTRRLIEHAQSLGLFVNIDMMVGLQAQTCRSFIEDVGALAHCLPDQITVYPYMIVRDVQPEPSMNERVQFKLIENVAKLLRDHGYVRKTVWSFTRTEGLYDSSRDELIEDYVGFGPAAFSAFGSWTMVNPELDVYVSNPRGRIRMGFVAAKSKTGDAWRKFARAIYDLENLRITGTPLPVRYAGYLLEFTGYHPQRCSSLKGRMYAHAVTKAVVGSQPFPPRNPQCVANYEDYVAFKEDCSPAVEAAG